MKRLLLSTISFLIIAACFSQNRSQVLLDKNWKFTREDDANAKEPGFIDSEWQSVSIPHDWAIYGPFDSRNDMQRMAIVQDGQKQAEEHAGRTGGLPFVGVGWYRTKIKVPQFGKGKIATIVFDGAMSHSNVFVNGKKVGYWPYGYNSFHFDITDAMKPGEENTIAV